MGILIDLIALIIIVAGAGIAYFKGFVKTFFGFISTIVAIMLACLLCKPIATQIKATTEIDEWLINSISSINIEKTEEEIEDNENVESEVNSEIETNEDVSLLGFIDSLPDSITESLDLEEAKNEFKNSLALKVTDAVINILSWLIIYAVARIILLVITLVFHGIMSIPFLKTINNLAGLFLGGIMGMFRVYLILAVVYFISNIANISGLVATIHSSILVSHMYDNNLLINLIF